MSDEAERRVITERLVKEFGQDAELLKLNSLDDLRWLLQLSEEGERIRQELGIWAAKGAYYTKGDSK